ncbi:hypothetical protein SAMN04490188_4081 [Pseudomonas kilonensis]|uniref:Uncharacterized protein n=1 Tax=Pseudomonas kilonensis TaxID=132476 RepID=A0ABY0ZAZ6_9PSED|nr:hypothetical protein SAMN04490188_4081 [Pseudomonas kilonensis]
MEWKGLSKSVNAERSKGYHVAAIKMMTNAHGLCFSLHQKRAADREVCSLAEGGLHIINLG